MKKITIANQMASREYFCRSAFRSVNGIALLTVLPIIAIISSLIYFVADAERFFIQRIDFQVQKLQMLNIAEVGESVAVDLLLFDSKEDKAAEDLLLSNSINLTNQGSYQPNNDSRLEQWAQIQDMSSWFPLDDDLAVQNRYIEIIDFNRFFNINNLHTDSSANEYSLDILFNIIAIEKMVETNDEITSLAYNLLDWLDPDDIRFGHEGERETDYYQQLGLVNYPPNRQINHISEIQYVAGMTDEVLGKLSQFVQAFPIYEKDLNGKIFYRDESSSESKNSKININTADEVVITALVGKFFKGDPAVINYIKRRQGLFTNIADNEFNLSSINSIIEANPLSLNSAHEVFIQSWMATHSQNFLVQSFIESNKFSFNLLSHVYRELDINFNEEDFSENIWIYQRQLAWNKLYFGRDENNNADNNELN